MPSTYDYLDNGNYGDYLDNGNYGDYLDNGNYGDYLDNGNDGVDVCSTYLNDIDLFISPYTQLSNLYILYVRGWHRFNSLISYCLNDWVMDDMGSFMSSAKAPRMSGRRIQTIPFHDKFSISK